MPTLQELTDKRSAAWAQATDYRDRSNRGDELSAEDEAAWQRAIDDVKSIGASIDLRTTDAALETRFGEIDAQTRPVGLDGERSEKHGDEYRGAFRKYCRFGLQGLTTEERALVEQNFTDMSQGEQRAQGTSSGGAGGYTVPQGFWAKVTETMKFYGGAIDGAEEISTDTGNLLPWPTNDDTAVVGYILGENTAATNEGDLTFGQKSLNAWTFVSGPVLASLQLIQDSGIDIEAFIAKKMGQRLGRIQNTRFTTGTGTSQPQGYITGATTGKTTAGATAITFDEVIDLIHSVDAAYRATGRCKFKMHDLILGYLMKLKDGQQRYLWQPSPQVGTPDTIYGYPYTVNNDMASTVATTNKTIAFGDYQSAYVVRKVSDASMLRLAERYAEYLQVGFIGYERADAIVQDSAAVKLLVQT